MNRKLSPVPFTSVTIEDRFWAPRMKAHKEKTVKACLDQCEKTGRISNFAKAAGWMEGEFEGIFFNDSDVYKVLEGVAYSLMNHPDPELEQAADEIIDKIAAAQQEDGYLLCYYILTDPEKRWTNMDKHEMYCGGHLIEAAIAYKQATGKTKLLDVACRVADHFDSLFGPGKRHWVPGHEEIELALIKLAHEIGEERYWKLAQWLLEERGHGHGVGDIWDKEDWGPKYCQDDKPIREMSDVGGHAVRAMYLYSAVTDAAALTGDEGYIQALDRLWDSVVNRNMYITGAIGSTRDNEGFTEDYDLPNDTAYCETCASVGMVYWNHRMNLLHGDSKYADVMERAMYNGAPAGVSLSGDRFFYVNPLSSDGKHHRVEWFGCSCCPTQIARFIPSIGNYVYALSDEGILVNLYLAGNAVLPVKGKEIKLTQVTDYPWDGRVDLLIDMEGEEHFELKLRLPGWCKKARISVNGSILEDVPVVNGYFKLLRDWQNGDRVSLELSMPVERAYSDPRVKANSGKVALQRGPLVYCFEQTDNAGELKISLSDSFETESRPDLLDGVTVIKVSGEDKEKLTAIPYYAWDNRDPGYMEVWVPETK